jgi:hypothetical protein
MMVVQLMMFAMLDSTGVGDYRWLHMAQTAPITSQWAVGHGWYGHDFS